MTPATTGKHATANTDRACKVSTDARSSRGAHSGGQQPTDTSYLQRDAERHAGQERGDTDADAGGAVDPRQREGKYRHADDEKERDDAGQERGLPDALGVEGERDLWIG